MKYVTEYRDGDLARQLIDKIHQDAQKPARLMEVCGTHTMSIFRHGIRTVLPDCITLLSGPGCPVCVTSQQDIDLFTALAGVDNVMVTTFGDLMRVPGTETSLQEQKAAGGDIRIVYSVFDALGTARAHPDRPVVFCAVGFETTTPTVAAALTAAKAEGISNFFIHSAHKLTPPALAALMQTPDTAVDGFLLPGHVSVITGTRGYQPVFETFQVPSVIAGFEPVDILQAIHQLVRQIKTGRPALENAYPRAVAEEGNPKARAVTASVFDVGDAVWRGIGSIPDSGMVLNDRYRSFDAVARFGISVPDRPEPPGCDCGAILMGLKQPSKCRLFGRRCTPMHPVGPCMVSSEGACAAWYRYGDKRVTDKKDHD